MAMNYFKRLPDPEVLKQEFPMTPELVKLKDERDAEIRKVFTGESDKFLVIIGPCSADREDAVCDYVERLSKVNEQVKDKLIIIPRIYTNKPRTTGEGYKGMLHQPDPNKEPDLYAGIASIRKMHINAIKIGGMTCADEMLYPENRSYLDDVLSYEAIGARSVENQQHRLTASGMDIPVGIKASRGDGISTELFQILKNDAVKVLHSICQHIWKTQQWPQDWKRSVFDQSQSRAIQKTVQTTEQLQSFHMLAK